MKNGIVLIQITLEEQTIKELDLEEAKENYSLDHAKIWIMILVNFYESFGINWL